MKTELSHGQILFVAEDRFFVFLIEASALDRMREMMKAGSGVIECLCYHPSNNSPPSPMIMDVSKICYISEYKRHHWFLVDGMVHSEPRGYNGE
jgi:hypothetical protein